MTLSTPLLRLSPLAHVRRAAVVVFRGGSCPWSELQPGGLQSVVFCLVLKGPWEELSMVVGVASGQFLWEELSLVVRVATGQAVVSLFLSKKLVSHRPRVGARNAASAQTPSPCWYRLAHWQ